MHHSVDSVIIVWKVDILQPGESDMLTFYARAHEAGQIRNAAQIVDIDTSVHSFDPDPKNRRDHTYIETTDVISDQRIMIYPSTFKWVSDSLDARWERVDTFTQGDTIRFTITVSKKNYDEKALGIKITLDTTHFRDGALDFVGYVDTSQHHLGSTFNDTTLVWMLNLDASPYATGELWLYAVAGSEIPARGELLDSIELYIYVEDTSIYYPQISSSSNETAKIYVEYCDLDLKVEVQAGSEAVYSDIPFDYYINIVNLREALLSTDSVTLVDTLPAGMSFRDVSPVPFDTSYYDDVSGRIVLRWNNLNSYLAGAKDGDTKQLVLQDCKGSSLGCYSNKAQILVNRHEATLSNNSGEDTVCVVSPVSFTLTFAAQHDTVTQGDEQELYLTITNYSESTQSDLSITAVDIPPQLRFVKSDRGGSFSSETNAFTWDNSSDNLPPNDSLTITLTVRAVNTGAAAWRAVLYTDGSEEMAVDTVKTYVKKNPYNVKLTKTASKSVFYRDEAAPYRFSYTISVENTGDKPVTNVIVRDTLPKGIDTVMPDFEKQHPTATVERVETVDGERLCIAFDGIYSLQSQEYRKFILPCQVKDTSVAAAYLNHAYATSSEREAFLNDNTDTALVEVRNVINLKLQMALCKTSGGDEYPSDHKYLQGDEFYVKVSVLNNGKRPTTDSTYVKITPSDSVLGSNFLFTPLVKSFKDPIPASTNSYLIGSDKCGDFTIGAAATTKTPFPTAADTITVKDSATVAFSILPGADMQVKVAVAPPATNYATNRAYTISLKNIGQYRADTVEMRHTLDSLIVSLDSIRLRPFGAPYRDTSIRISTGDTLYKDQNHEFLTYSRADKMLTCGIDAVEVGSSAEIMLFVTTAKPSAEAVLKIYPYAEVFVFENRDKALGNNRAHSATPIEVHPNPYNVSISITPEREDLRYTSDADSVSQEYTITAKNIGKYPAEGSVSYKTSAGLVITEYTDNADISDDLVSWTIPQLLAGKSVEFSVTVRPENKSVKGHKRSIVEINPVFMQGTTANPETDLEDNCDTAYLNLFSVLQSWPLMEAFSPNGDGKNDRFMIHDLESNIVERAEMVIVNRYGSEVYYHRNYKEAQLDESAAFTGVNLPEGSYFYQLTVHFTDGSVDKRGGAITIRRSRWR
jgi:gliding motility-associated-like protein/uncharacterized repeat protein (TIGR01451 family)